MKEILNKFFITSLIFLVIAEFLIPCSVAESSIEGSINPFIPPFDPDTLPSSVGGIVMGSASSFTSTTENTASDTSNLKSEVITENRLILIKGQSATHMITFEKEGSVTVKSLKASGIKVFSKKGGDWPTNVTFQSDYGKSDLVTSLEPLTLDITPGTWYFTLIPLGDEGSYDLVASQRSDNSTQTPKSAPMGSFSSSMGASSFSMG